MNKDVVTIFTDGSADNRIADCGAAAAVIRYKEKYREVVSGSWSSTTNNRMELLGIIIGLEAVKSGFKISLTSDSQYCLGLCDQFINEEPSDKEITRFLNGDLLIRLNKAILKHKGDLKFNWVRGHIGVADNERCDVLAGEAALWSDITRDVGSGIAECPKMVWIMNELKSRVYLEDQLYVDEPEFYYGLNGNESMIGFARKMSNKEVTQLLRDDGWKLKDIKKLEIDKSNYEKPLGI